MTTKSHRAKPMPPEARRNAILAAVIPLLIERGAAATTAEMAKAADIAEGTIFRVFPDKSALILEAVKVTMDPDAVRATMEAISATDSLQDQLIAAGGILVERFQRVSALAEVLRSMPNPPSGQRAEAHQFVTAANTAITAAVAGLFERHVDQLVIPPTTAASAFRGLVFATANPMMKPGERLGLDEAVTILLGGVAKAASSGA